MLRFDRINRCLNLVFCTVVFVFRLTVLLKARLFLSPIWLSDAAHNDNDRCFVRGSYQPFQKNNFSLAMSHPYSAAAEPENRLYPLVAYSVTVVPRHKVELADPWRLAAGQTAEVEAMPPVPISPLV